MSKKSATHILSWITSEKWHITEESLRTILSIANRENFESKYEAILARGGEPLRNTRNVVIRQDTAIIPLIGPIFPRANIFTEISGAVSIEQLTKDFMTAMDSPEVENIVFSIDSPGGQSTGIGEFSQLVFEGREKKSITAFVEGGAHSAAYWIAAQASKIILAPGAMVGSIGTVVTLIDDSKQLEQIGIEEIEIVSSLSPNKRPDPKTKAGREGIMEVLDDLTRIFAEGVGRGRGVSTETVLKDFGQGKSFVGQRGIDLGMADSSGTLESVISQLTNNNQLTGGSGMDLTKLTSQEIKAGNPTLFNEISNEGHTTGHAEGLNVGKTEGHAAGVKAENERIQKIESYESNETKDIIAKHKFDSTKSAEEVAGIVLAEQKKKTDKVITDRNKDGADLATDTQDIDASASSDNADKQKDSVNNIVGGANHRRQRYTPASQA